MKSPIPAGRDGHGPAALAAAGATATLSRRRLLLGLSALAVSPLSFSGEARDNPEAIIDVHAHFQPETLRQLGLPGPMASWSVQKHLEDMEAAGVTRSLLSITTPGVPDTGERARSLARRINEDAAKLASDHPGRLGYFLALPMDDPDSALKEIEYGFDTLKAPGVGLYTSYGTAWLGDPRFDPVFEELNRRKAVVYIHPNTADCCTNLLSGIADTLIEYGTDTTRAITNYIYKGAARRFPGVRMIWSHSGGTMPFLMERFEGADRNPAMRNQAPDGYRAAASRFFYDIAQSTHAIPSRALKSLVPVDHIVFGSDYPFRTTLEHVQGLQAAGVYSADERAGIYAGNVRRHLPELLGRAG